MGATEEAEDQAARAGRELAEAIVREVGGIVALRSLVALREEAGD